MHHYLVSVNAAELLHGATNRRLHHDQMVDVDLGGFYADVVLRNFWIE